MVGGSVITKLREKPLGKFFRDAFVKENLPYVMGTFSLLVMILTVAASSATATIT